MNMRIFCLVRNCLIIVELAAEDLKHQPGVCEQTQQHSSAAAKTTVPKMLNYS